jgi:hypothetical protein
MTRRTRLISALAWGASTYCCLPQAARADEPPSQEEVFAAGPVRPSATTDAERKTAGEDGARTRADELLGDKAPAAGPGITPETDKLVLGGQLYLRSAVSALRSQNARDWYFSTPSLLDLYLDARPSDRVRVFARTRTGFDFAQPPDALRSGAPSGSPGPVTYTASTQRGPQTVIDQLWLRFDLNQLVFVSAGRQHDTWGTGRIWHPTDFLHTTPRNPLDPFDVRTGLTMLRVQIPWEALGWNFYLYGLTENEGNSTRLGNLGGALRSQLVLGTAELGLGVLSRPNQRPRYAADLSLGLGPFDFYGEAALREGGEVDRVGRDQNYTVPSATLPTVEQIADGAFPRFRRPGYQVQSVAGLDYRLAYGDNDALVITGEYFFNQLGYSGPESYLGVFLPRSVPLSQPAAPFYLGRHYAALSINADGPFSWDQTALRLSVLSNLSDRSWVARFDYGLTVLSHVHFEAFAAGHFGASRGEFRAQSSLFVKDEMGNVIDLPQFSRPSTLFDLGLALRVNI